MGIYIRVILTVFILLFGLAPCFADINEARNNYEKGNTLEALLIYENWLSNNQKSSDFSSVLFEISELSGDIGKISLLLEKQIDFVQERDDRKILYNRLAQFFELSANLDKAQIYYQKAALISPEVIDYGMLLESAKILLLEGEFILAESQLKELIVNSLDKSILTHGKLLFTILKILNSNGHIDYTLSPVEKPEIIYLMYLIAKTNSETVVMDNLSKKLVNDFETSPEAGLIRKEFAELPDLITSFALLYNGSLNENYLYEKLTETLNSSESDTILNYMIQTGSFRDPENAHYLSIDLTEQGFEPIVEEQTINDMKYYKVILYLRTKDEMYQTLNMLKDKGFEGFPVY